MFDKGKILSAFQRIMAVPAEATLNNDEVFILYGMVVGAWSQSLSAANPSLVGGYLREAISANGLDVPIMKGGSPC